MVMETTAQPPIDKSTWGEGPWQAEPDRVEFRHAGLPCLILRNPHLGQLCGYAAVPPGHPLHGKGYDDVDVEVHGGLTYADRCAGSICHVPEPGEPADVYWFGFDCGHFLDLVPAMEASMAGIGLSLSASPESVSALVEEVAAAARPACGMK